MISTTKPTPFGTTAAEVTRHAHLLSCSSWSAWYTLWRYASDHGLLNADIERGTDRAEKTQPVTDRQLKAAEAVVDHALQSEFPTFKR
jgi:hypothetical protein